MLASADKQGSFIVKVNSDGGAPISPESAIRLVEINGLEIRRLGLECTGRGED